ERDLGIIWMTVLAGFDFPLGSADHLSVDCDRFDARPRQQLIAIEALAMPTRPLADRNEAGRSFLPCFALLSKLLTARPTDRAWQQSGRSVRRVRIGADVRLVCSPNTHRRRWRVTFG